jgi:hopanoid biosynthesis associated protein HpnK
MVHPLATRSIIPPWSDRLGENRTLKQLIVNADDFGYTSGVNRAIVEAHRTGIVSSTSLLANGAAFADAVERWRASPSLDVGCHLNLVEGAPLSPREHIPHLVNSGGEFPGLRQFAMRLATGRIPASEMEGEFSAQIAKLVAAGLRPSHLDTHQHIHLHPRVGAVLARVGRQHGIGWARRLCEHCPPPWRYGAWGRRAVAAMANLVARSAQSHLNENGLKTADAFTGFVLTGRLTSAALRATLAALPEGVTELMCHPGYRDAELSAASTVLQQQREIEFHALADASWRDWLRERGVRLTSFRELTVTS